MSTRESVDEVYAATDQGVESVLERGPEIFIEPNDRRNVTGDGVGAGREYCCPRWVRLDSSHGMEEGAVKLLVECRFERRGGVIRLRRWRPCL